MWVCLGSSYLGPSVFPVPKYLLPSLGLESFSHSFFKYSFDPLFFFPSGTPIIHSLSCFTLSHRSHSAFIFFFHLFFWLLDWLGYFHHSVFQIISLFFCISLLFIAPRPISILATILSNFDWFLFVVSSSLLQDLHFY